ncbi:MAG TPA: hypothetical protein IGS40_10530 [Trichormus sp. M33_DOE_039]|nr:hypothetical protein [Trichormus sp. M33_DOE_039]
MTELIVTVLATKSPFAWHILRFWEWVLGIGEQGLGIRQFFEIETQSKIQNYFS